jgi:hypothetical protein
VRTSLAGMLVVTCALVLGMPLSGSAQTLVSQIQTELKTAMFHAGELAQKADTLGAVQLHTHHVLNCLEGPNGADFFAQAGYPCKGQGNGIIPDLQMAVAQHVPGAQDALQEAMIAQTLAKQALASKDINEAQPFVLVLSRHLQAASKDLGM